MQRPISIVRYEQLYLAAVATGLANTALGWSQSVATFAANPSLQAMAWVLPVATMIGLVVRLTLWYFTARRPSVVAKWAVVALATISGLILLFGVVALIAGATPSLAAAIAGIVSGILYVVSAAYLFRSDTHAWFGERDEEPSE